MTSLSAQLLTKPNRGRKKGSRPFGYKNGTASSRLPVILKQSKIRSGLLTPQLPNKEPTGKRKCPQVSHGQSLTQIYHGHHRVLLLLQLCRANNHQFQRPPRSLRIGYPLGWLLGHAVWTLRNMTGTSFAALSDELWFRIEAHLKNSSLEKWSDLLNKCKTIQWDLPWYNALEESTRRYMDTDRERRHPCRCSPVNTVKSEHQSLWPTGIQKQVFWNAQRLQFGSKFPSQSGGNLVSVVLPSTYSVRTTRMCVLYRKFRT